jgi:hypothetical protein
LVLAVVALPAAAVALLDASVALVLAVLALPDAAVALLAASVALVLAVVALVDEAVALAADSLALVVAVVALPAAAVALLPAESLAVLVSAMASLTHVSAAASSVPMTVDSQVRNASARAAKLELSERWGGVGGVLRLGGLGDALM